MYSKTHSLNNGSTGMVVTTCLNTLLHKLLGPVFCRTVKMPTDLEGLSGHLKMQEKNPDLLEICLKK